MSDKGASREPRRPRNPVASISTRLLALAREQREDFQLVLMRYGLERLLYRLGRSAYADQFIVKGAMLFTLWAQQSAGDLADNQTQQSRDATNIRLLRRATRDLDLLGIGPNDIERLQRVFYELVKVEADQDDGLTYLEDTIHALPIRAEQRYQGVRVQLLAMLGKARIPLQIDVGFGDVVTPAAREVSFPTLLRDLAAPQVHVYPRETVVAEKFEALVTLGMPNTRLKDFYDLWILASRFHFDGASLSAALLATFNRRGAILPTEAPIALTAQFSDDSTKRAQWAAFLRKGRLEPDAAPDLSQVVATLRAFLLPPCHALAHRDSFIGAWPAGGPWMGAASEYLTGV